MSNLPVSLRVCCARPLSTVTAVTVAAVAAALFSLAEAAGAGQPAPPAAAPQTRVVLIVQDQVALRAAPRDTASAQALLWRGEGVEVRAERGDHLQVWDYRRERGGYVRKGQVLPVPQGPGAAAELLAQLRLARLQPGNETLGLGLAAAYIQAAPAADMAGAGGTEALDALGVLAERMAERVSAQNLNPAGAPSKAAEAQGAAQLEVAARYGLRFVNFEAADGRVQVCYEGEMFRRVLAMAADPEQRARAALALTRPECASPDATPREIEAHDAWRSEVLARASLAGVPPHWKNRLLMRRASVAASLAFAQARRGASKGGPANYAAAALSDFGAIVAAELAEEDVPGYNDAAMRVNAARWLAQADVAPALAGLSLSTEPGADGQTCVLLRDTRKPAGSVAARRCSFGVVLLASASVNREANALALAVQPLDGWRELWVFVATGDGWRIDVMPPAAAQPGIGFAEFAGWLPGGTQMLVAREARAEGRYKRSFELVSLAHLGTERQSGEPRALGPFQRWADAAWLRDSLSRR